tara:strand:+ start:183 stop:551 length:369 start_codon:yes stop_codon:yes gene_type:complete
MRRDYLGILLAVGCMFHCLILPCIAVLIPHVASFAEDEWVHVVMFCVVLLVGIAAFFVRPSLWRVKAMAAVGLTLLGGAMLASSEEVEIAITTLGSVVFLMAHISNIRNSGIGCSGREEAFL